MTPRPRKASDEDVFAAAMRVMARLGPTQITLAEIAAEAGVTAGALVQRFGSKRDVLLALMERWAGASGEMFAALRAGRDSPLAVLYAYADCHGRMADSPASLAHHLSYLQVDLTDPDFHRHTLRQARATRAQFRRLLDEAVAAGELASGVDTAALARAVEVTISGSLMTWGLYQKGNVTAWMRHDLDALLRPYLPSPRLGPRPRPPRLRRGRRPSA